MNKEFEIYKLTNTNNNKIYIGVTTLGVSQRFKIHCWKASEGSSYPLHQAIKEHGKDAFRLEVIETVESPTVAREKEKYFIKLFNRGCYNYEDPKVLKRLKFIWKSE